jgi:hypothetical protein
MLLAWLIKCQVYHRILQDDRAADKIVINISFAVYSLPGGNQGNFPFIGVDPVLKPIIDRGVTIVTSAGNDGKSLDKVQNLSWPQNVLEVIVVGASDKNDKRAIWDPELKWFRSHREGAELPRGSRFGQRVDIWAPGLDV